MAKEDEQPKEQLLTDGSRIVDIKPLMRAAGIVLPGGVGGDVVLTKGMSGVESNPKNDWMYLGLSGLGKIARSSGVSLKDVAFIGSGNGIIEIGACYLFRPQRLVATDLLESVLDDVRGNIDYNLIASRFPSGGISCYAGRDCEPLPVLDGGYDLIYGNLPLLVGNVDDRELVTTTVVDGGFYEGLSNGEGDVLAKWSLLPQLGFLLSAKEKLSVDGRVVTLIGGRVPYSAIDECFTRAGFDYNVLGVGLMQQSDPAFLKDYADFEKEKLGGDTFLFLDPDKLKSACERKGVDCPGLVEGEELMKELVESARVSAGEAFRMYRDEKGVVYHIGCAFEARVKRG